MQGNTGPYLQYAIARIRSILRKLEFTNEEDVKIFSHPETEAEIDLARKLLHFPIALEHASRELKPHLLCTYLYELATEFSSFYNREKVIVDDQKVQGTRLLLCLNCHHILVTGLELLGISCLDEM